MQQRCSWEAGSSKTGQEFPRILQNPKVHYRIHKCQPRVLIMSRIHLAHASRSHLLKISFIIVFLSMLRSSKFFPQVQSYKICCSQRINFFLNFKWSFCRPYCRPLDCAAQGGRNTRSRPLAIPLHLLAMCNKTNSRYVYNTETLCHRLGVSTLKLLSVLISL